MPFALFLLLGFAGVLPRCKQTAGVFGGLAGFGKGNGGIFADGQCFFFATYAVFQAEDFAACGGNFQIQAAAVKQLGLFPCFGWLGVFDLSVIQWHGGGMF